MSPNIETHLTLCCGVFCIFFAAATSTPTTTIDSLSNTTNPPETSFLRGGAVTSTRSRSTEYDYEVEEPDLLVGIADTESGEGVVAASWVQYALYGSQDTSCTSQPHYYYWQALNTCVKAENIPGYYTGDGYVKIGCSADTGGVVTLTNTFYSSSTCDEEEEEEQHESERNTSIVVVKNTVMQSSCDSQKDGAFKVDVGTFSMTFFDDDSGYSPYVTLVGNKIATQCIVESNTPWADLPNANGVMTNLFDKHGNCSSEEKPPAFDLFVYDVCSRQDSSVWSDEGGEYVRLSDCNMNIETATFMYYTDANCSINPVSFGDYYIHGSEGCVNDPTNTFDLTYSLDAVNTVTSTYRSEAFCLRMNDGADGFAEEEDDDFSFAGGFFLYY